MGLTRQQLPIRTPVLISVALKNIMAKKLRTSLTIGGIMLGVGAIVFLVSLADGLHETVNTYVIGSRSVKSIDVTSPDTATIPLSKERIEKIKGFANIEKVTPTYILPAKVSNNDSLTDAVLYGTSTAYVDLSSLTFMSGDRSLNTPDGVIVSKSLLDLIGQRDVEKAIGTAITITTTITTDNGSPKEYKGVFKVTGVANISNGVAVYINDFAFRTANAGMTPYGQAKVIATNTESVGTLRKQIAGLGLTTASPLDTLNDIDTIFRIFTFVVAGFGGIGMVIAILGMFNTLTISLLERTREISLMIIMGALQKDIRRLLMLEALLLSLPGALGGVAIAWLLGSIANIWLARFAHDRGVQGAIQIFNVTPILVIVAIVATLFVGLVVALYPAWRASRIDPIESLANE